ncbi:MAG TPA: flagellar filament capping protein FliD [Vicinamibacterales bacterium]|nr:flagellar filament capping protein FliD [Vicinamibacterales bacterium]
MAGLSSSGVGSGLDINSLVSQLVAAEKETPQKQITRAQTSTVTTISALGNLKGALGSFNSSLTQLKSIDAFMGRTASSSKPEVFTASAGTTTAAGTYDVEVVQIASAAQIKSNQFAGGAGQTVGTGTLTINVGTKNFQVAIDTAHSTLAGIRDSINQAIGNTDLVRATIVNATDGAHLVLTGTATGEANAITVAQADGNGGLASLVYNPGLTTNYAADSRIAQDSIVAVAGFAKHSATTTVTDIIEGVSISLLKADPGNIYTLTIANDKSTVTTRIKNFVDQYNSMVSTLAGLSRYEPTTKVAGPLLGDAMLRGIETDVRRALTDTNSGSTVFSTLAAVGITTQKDGTLVLDNAKLTTALSTNFDEVAKLFGGDNGVATRLSGALAPRLAADAEIDVRSKRLNQQSIDLQKKQAALDTRMAQVEARYKQQFTALDSLLSKLQNTSSFLTTQLSSIAKISTGS